MYFLRRSAAKTYSETKRCLVEREQLVLPSLADYNAILASRVVVMAVSDKPNDVVIDVWVAAVFAQLS